MGDARVVFLLEKIGETFGVSPDELRGDMDGLGDKVRPFFEPEGPPKLIFVYQAPDTVCLLYTSPSPRDATLSRMPSSA